MSISILEKEDNLSKSQVNRLGKKIKSEINQNRNPSIDSYNLLQEYRTSFKNDVTSIFDKVSKLAYSLRSDSIIAFRIKRIESIVSKLMREPTMSLGNMGDIAGCRVIMYEDNAIDKLVKFLHQTFKVLNTKDYLKNSKPDGYRGIHLYIQSPISPNKKIEIQIRLIHDHMWASMVETIDILYSTKIKEGQIHQDFQKFHFLLSKKDKLTIEEKVEVIEIDKRNNIYGKLSTVFINNFVRIREEWYTKTNQSTPYLIIEVDESEKSNLFYYNSYESAETEYYNKFKEHNNSNFVLAYIEKVNFKRLCIAYSSYLLAQNEYDRIWDKFTEEIVDHYIGEKNVSKSKKFLEYIQINLDDKYNLFKIGIQEFKTLLKSKDSKLSNYAEWALDVGERINLIEERKQLVKDKNNQIQSFNPAIKMTSTVNLWKKIINKIR